MKRVSYPSTPATKYLAIIDEKAMSKLGRLIDLGHFRAYAMDCDGGNGVVLFVPSVSLTRGFGDSYPDEREQKQEKS